MSARGIALRTLHAFAKGRIERVRDALDRAQLPPRERALAHELTLGVVRNERFLDFVLACFAHRGLPRDPLLLAALRLGAYQLLLLSGMPARAAVHETVALLRRERAFANAILRRVAGRIEPRAAAADQAATEIGLAPARTLLLPPPGLAAAADPVAVRHSLPDFLLARWRREHGDAAAAAIAAASSAVPTVFLRAAGGRDAGELAAALAAEGVQTRRTDHARVVAWDGGTSPFATAAFADGWFVAQDPTAVAAAEAVGAAPGQTIVDLCAAPGTKSTLLAERVRPDGVVFAHDVDARRRRYIADNARRLRLEPWLRLVERPGELPRADAVLADVPCSNTGVLARRVEVRRRLHEGVFAALAATQRGLLQQALRLCRPSGTVVYATCSIEPEENAGVVEAVAAATGARLVRQQLTLPCAGRCDGGYFAVLRPGAGTGGGPGVPGPAGGG